jgi:hypothetical protein
MAAMAAAVAEASGGSPRIGNAAMVAAHRRCLAAASCCRRCELGKAAVLGTAPLPAKGLLKELERSKTGGGEY